LPRVNSASLDASPLEDFGVNRQWPTNIPGAIRRFQ
jgi:hypothetical protein